MHEHSHLYNLVNGLIGTLASLLGVISTFQEQLEYSIRIMGGVLGVMIGIVTLYNALKKKK